MGSNQGRPIDFLRFKPLSRFSYKYSLILYCPLKLKYTCMFSVSTNSLLGHVFTNQCARTYVYVHVHNGMSVDARALCKYIFRWLPRSKCFSVKHALCAPYAHFGMQSVQMELWTTTLLSHFNIDRYQVCAHECTFKGTLDITKLLVFSRLNGSILFFISFMSHNC